MPASPRLHRALFPGLLCLLLAAAGAEGAGIRTGEDYVRECGSADDAERRECRDPVFGEVVALQANQSRQPNPFARCPVQIIKPDELARVLEALQLEIVRWLKRNPDMQDEPVTGLIRIAMREIDVCSLDY